MQLLEIIFFNPVLNAVVWLYDVFGDLGIAVIIITLIIRLLLLPLANKAFRSQRRLQALQPELQKLQEKHKDDREAMAREVMAFYKREGVSPTSSCLPTLIQIPILITLFYVFRYVVGDHNLDASLYPFVHNPGYIDPHFLGIIDLSKPDKTFVLPVITALLQFQQSRMLLPASGPAATGMTKQLTYIFPIVTFVFATSLPAALPLYWATSTLFTIIQQYVVMKEMPTAEARKEGIKDWNKANPDDPIKNGGSNKPEVVKDVKGVNVTVRKRKGK